MLHYYYRLQPKDVFETRCPETANPLVQEWFCSSFTCCLRSTLQCNPNHKSPGPHSQKWKPPFGYMAFVLTMILMFLFKNFVVSSPPENWYPWSSNYLGKPENAMLLVVEARD